MVSGYKKELGKAGEEMAVNYLFKKGYEILARNFRCRSGEIDIVARDGEYIVFIEVKTRTGLSFGTAIEAIDYRKQNRLQKIASFYLLRTGQTNANCRFDVVTLQQDTKNKWKIDIIKNAF